ncbi:acetyl-CoA carboxylase carboxyltransferase subunit alpha [Nonomuraea sp. PA05]|uniref:acetyl-CoA carboxylase carboxyltransferase subunit alpha n=1 Tax=Nonomuraea sp. PA05 TaxID=2604466 RepID=UPI0021CCC2A3|nr:acetyl-CoA carboxylase carboxyltransferase subunit alpha [Nonomuraea sp. PA05]
MGVQTEASEAAPWISCPECRELVYSKRLARDLGVCPACGAYSRLDASQRVAQLVDAGSVVPFEPPVTVEDPIGFADSLPYRDRLRNARERTGADEAVTCVTASVTNHPVIVAVMDFRFLGGSLGVGVGERIVRACETALRTRTPLLLITASGGARMQEGAFALMQMAKTSQAMAELDEAGILTLSLVTNPTYGGVAASFATLTDVILAESGARIGFAGPRVIRQTIQQELPPGFQSAEFMQAKGFVDAVVPRPALRPVLGGLLGMVRPDGAPAATKATRLIRDPAELPERDPWEVVRLARHGDRPTTLDYVYQLLDDFQELKGDRLSGDCPAIVGGIGRLDGRPIVLIGHQKGHDTAERVSRNFGMALPEGYRKAARLMRLAEKLGLPVVTLVDTPGAHPGIEAEERGQAWAIAENLRLMSGLKVPIVSVITGEGGSGGALALATADRVLAFSNAVYSVISPEGCAAILWKDQAEAPRAAAALRLDARELLRHGIVDAVLPEPRGGAHENPAGAAETLRAALGATLPELTRLNPRELVERRRRRFRRYGIEDARNT